MKTEFLRTLAAVVRHGSFAAAAPEVNLSASAVGLQIRQLEAYFGQPLFDRSARNVRPTPFAIEVIAAAEPALDALDALRSRVVTAVSGHLRLGTIESTQIALLPPAMRALRSTAPALELRCVRGVSGFLLDELKASRLDAAIVVRPESGGSSRLHWMPLLTESFVLVAPPGAKGTVRELLASHEWIRLDRSATGGRIAASFVESLLPGKRGAMELPGTDAIVAMVAAGLGVSVIPELREDVRRTWQVREIGLGAKGPVRHIAMVCRAADAENRRVLAVRDAFLSAVGRRPGRS